MNRGTPGTVLVVRASRTVRYLALVPPLICVVVFVPLVITAGTGAVVPLAVTAVITALVVTAVCVGAAARMRLEVRCTSDAVTLVAPFYRASFAPAAVQQVRVAADPGTNGGLVNWPVTGSAGSPRGVRLNLGGTAQVRLDGSPGGRYTVVTRDRGQAEMLAAAITTDPGDRRGPPAGAGP